MSNIINKAKQSIKNIHWPAKKQIFADTMFSVITATILSLMISGWTQAIEYVVDWVVSLF